MPFYLQGQWCNSRGPCCPKSFIRRAPFADIARQLSLQAEIFDDGVSQIVIRTVQHMLEALEEKSWNVNSNSRSIVGAYVGNVNATLLVEQLYGDRRKAERLLQVRWGAPIAQLQRAQLRSMGHRWKDSCNGSISGFYFSS